MAKIKLRSAPAHTAVAEYKDAGINHQERVFAERYAHHMNAKLAALEAGFSERSAHVTGPNLLSNVRIARVIEDLLDQRSLRTQITQDQVLRELAIIATSNIANYEIDEDGNVSLHEEAPVEAIKAVSSIKRTVRFNNEGEKIIETQIRLWDKNTALNLLGKHLGTFIERHSHAHLHKGEIEVKQKWEFGGREIVF